MSDYVYGLNKSGLSVIKLLYNQKKTDFGTAIHNVAGDTLLKGGAMTPPRRSPFKATL